MQRANPQASVNGFFRLKNLMACGKGAFAVYGCCRFTLHFIEHVQRLKWFVLCSLIYDAGLKQRLLRYAASALLFTEKGVDPFLVSWNRYYKELSNFS